MKYFDLSLPNGVNDKSPKVHKITFDAFKEAWVDFPRDVAERMVELGYGRWVPANSEGAVIVPQGFLYPEQFMFVTLPTRTVKAVHVNSLVPENGPIPADLVLFAANLKENVWYKHDEADLIDAEAYDLLCTDEEDELYDQLISLEEKKEEAKPKAEKKEAKKAAKPAEKPAEKEDAKSEDEK